MITPVNYGLQQVVACPLGLPPGIPAQTYVNRNAIPPTLPPPDVPGQNLPRALTYLADYGGCGFYRCMGPNMLLNLHQKAVVIESTCMILDPRFYGTVESIKFQRQATTHQKDFVKAIQQLIKSTPNHSVKKLIYEVDDVVFADDIPLYNRNRDAFTDPKIQESINEILQSMDEIVVTTEYFRDYVIARTGIKNVTSIPNYLMKWWFDRYYNLGDLVKNFEKNKKKPIVACFASGTHVDVANRTNQQDDFTEVVPWIRKTKKDFEWRFYGSHPLPLQDEIKRGDVKFFPWTQLPDFPESMSNSGAQITFAALQDNEFNRCKSNIKLIESGALGMPCVCPDMVTYKDAFLKYKNGSEFIDCLKTALKNQTTYADYCKKSRSHAEQFWLDTEENLMKHHELLFTPFNSPERKYIKS